MKHDRFRSLIGIAAICAMVTGCGKGAAKESEPEAEPAVVEVAIAKVAPIEQVISGQGTLVPTAGAEAKLAPAEPGRLTEVLFREGDRVHAGDLVARIDNATRRAQSAGAAAAVRASEYQTKQSEFGLRASTADAAAATQAARLGLQAAQIDREAAVKQAQIAVQTARADLVKTRSGARPQELAQAEQSVRQAKATRDRFASERDRAELLFRAGTIPKKRVDEAKNEFVVADSALESAVQQLALLRSGARPEDLRSAELRVEQSEQALLQTQASGDLRVKQAETLLKQTQQSHLQLAAKTQEVSASREVLEQKRSDLTAARSAETLGEIRSPVSGIVTRRLKNPGELADTTTPVLEILAENALDMIANISAADIAAVKVGLQARIHPLDSTDSVQVGKVLSIGSVDAATGLIPVRTRILGANHKLRSGSFASVEIVVSANSQAVTLPKAALLTKEDKTVVYLVGTDNVAHERSVSVGAEQNGTVEITKGVKTGDRVVKLGHFELSDGAKIQVATAKSEAESK